MWFFFLDRITYPNRTSQRIQQNEFGEIIGLTHQTNGMAGYEELHKYDGLGNIVEINRTRGNQSSNERFSYDGLNRLVQEDIEPGQIKYVYDERGNRQQRSTTFDEDQPTTKQTHYSYNAANMLNRFSDKEEGTEYSYTYYADGLRATKMGTNEGVRYVYLNGNVIEELNLDSYGNVTGVKARNIWGNELLYREDNNSNKAGYYLYNGHGDVIQINDSAGTMLNSYEYDTWGKIISMAESMSNPYRYTGQYYDDESGLYYLRARYYDPVDGRFVSEDTYKGTLTNPLTLNLYTYVQNNPLVYFDPSGNYSINTHWNLSKGLLGYWTSSRLETIESVLTTNPYTLGKGAYQLGRAMYKGEITLGDIASFIGEDLITPFEYVVENGNYIFTGDPTKQEAYIYGEQLGKSNPWILLGIPLPEEQFCHQKLRQNSRSQPLLF